MLFECRLSSENVCEVVRIDVIPSDRVSITFSEILSLSSESFVMMSNDTIGMSFTVFVYPNIETFRSFTDLNWRRIATFLNHNLSENVSPTGVVYFGDSTFFKHIITHITKNLELLLSGESICPITFRHDSGHLCFSCDHQFQEKRGVTV